MRIAYLEFFDIFTDLPILIPLPILYRLKNILGFIGNNDFMGWYRIFLLIGYISLSALRY